MRSRAAPAWLAAALATAALGGAVARAAAAEPPRIEARSARYLAVGVVQGGNLRIHLSRTLDNAPVRDAAVEVQLRGVRLPATAQTDGSYSLQSDALRAPGAATLAIDVTEGGTRERLQGTLRIEPSEGKAAESSNLRQIGWWVLNFTVCIGFLLLISRRRQAKPD